MLSRRVQRSFMSNKLPLKQSITEHSHACQKRHAGMQETGGTQQTNVSQYVNLLPVRLGMYSTGVRQQ